MIKDPLFLEETPYELLELDLNTPIMDIHQALAKFMKNKKNIPKIGKAQEAIKKLKSVEDRIAIDLMFYSIEVMDNIEVENLTDINSILEQHSEVPSIEYCNLYSDIFKERNESEFSSITYHSIKTGELSYFDDIEKVQLYMPFKT